MDSGNMMKNTNSDISSNPKPVWRTRLVKGRFPDREFDIAFWQEQGDNAIFRAA
jgi:hypothetical protein